MRMLTDNPIGCIARDRFGFQVYASLLAKSIQDTEDVPFCLGVFGAWGTGKTSLMQMISEELSADHSIKTVHFNPWKYDKQEAIWSALIQSLLYEIAERKGGPAGDKAKRLATSVAWLLLKKGIGVATGGVVSGETMESLKAVVGEVDEHYYRHMNRFEQDFEDVVKDFTGGGKLVVFVDDLDRCLPENAITILESLKLFMGNARCVFVLGMDPYVVEQGITSRYGKILKMSGRDYLDKIIQIPFFLPPVPFGKLKQALQEGKAAGYDNRIWRVLELGLAGNPRKTIRFVNSFYLLQEIVAILGEDAGLAHDTGESSGAEPLEPGVQQYYLAKLMIFQLGFSEFYAYLEHHPDAWSIFETQLIGAASVEDRQLVFERSRGMEEFWSDDRLRMFMERTAGVHGQPGDSAVPPAPNESTVRSLMKAISLVGQSSGGRMSGRYGPQVKSAAGDVDYGGADGPSDMERMA